MGSVNAEYENTLSQNHFFAGNCVVTITQVGNMRARLEDLCSAPDVLNDILGDVHNRGIDMADSKSEALK